MKQQILNLHPKFSLNELEKGLDKFQIKSFKAKEFILTERKTFNLLYFANSSISKCFCIDQKGNEKVIWIEPSRMFLTEFESFYFEMPSKYSVQFYQDTEVWLIPKEDLLNLYQTHKDWAIWGRKMMEFHFVRLLQLFTSMFKNDASNNYQFMEDNLGQLLKSVPLKDIASMLNVSPVTISRIRAGTQTKK